MSDIDPTLNFMRLPDGEAREAARKAAYEAHFQSPLGRSVLADMLVTAGACSPSGPPGGAPGTSEYLAGLRDGALSVAETAGFTPAAVATVVMTQGEDGFYDGRSEFPD